MVGQRIRNHPSSAANAFVQTLRIGSNRLRGGARDDKTSVIETSLHSPAPASRRPDQRRRRAGHERRRSPACASGWSGSAARPAASSGGFAGLAERRAARHDRGRSARPRRRGGHLARDEPLEGARDRGRAVTRASGARGARPRRPGRDRRPRLRARRPGARRRPPGGVRPGDDRPRRRRHRRPRSGMDSAIGFALETIDQLRVTGRSLPGRAFLVQTLGRTQRLPRRRGRRRRRHRPGPRPRAPHRPRRRRRRARRPRTGRRRDRGDVRGGGRRGAHQRGPGQPRRRPRAPHDPRPRAARRPPVGARPRAGARRRHAWRSTSSPRADRASSSLARRRHRERIAPHVTSPTTNPRSARMSLGYDRPLYILAFDHRTSFATKLFGISGAPTDAERERMAEAKRIIGQGLLAVAESARPERARRADRRGERRRRGARGQGQRPDPRPGRREELAARVRASSTASGSASTSRRSSRTSSRSSSATTPRATPS